MASKRCGILAGWPKLLIVGLLCLSGTAYALPTIEHWQTASGARVLFVAARELPMVDFSVVFDAGSARDGDRPGTARFTNALLMEGAGGLDSDRIAERFSELGARVSTWSERDMAGLDARMLSDPQQLDTTVSLVSLILQRPDFPPQAVARVRKQMLTALENDEQSPGSRGSKAFYQKLYGTHPYGSSSGGTPTALQQLQRGDLEIFHARYYSAANALISIVGDLSRSEAEALAEKLASALPTGEAAATLTQAPETTQAQELHISHPSSQAHILLGQHGMRRGDPDYFPLYVGNHILGGNGLNSRISQEVREKRGLAYSAYSYFLPMRVEGPFLLGLQTRNSQKDEAIAVLKETLENFVHNGPDESALAAAKQNLIGGFALRLDSNKKILGYLRMIGFYNLPLDYLARFSQNIRELTVEKIREAFQRRIHPEHLLQVVVGPTSSEQPKRP